MPARRASSYPKLRRKGALQWKGETISTFATDSEIALWQQISALAYAFAGGYADAAGYLLARTFTGHVTGNLVLLAISLQHRHWGEIGQRFIAIVTFLLATGVGFRVARFRNALSPLTLFLAQACLIGTVSLPIVSKSHNYAVWLVTALCLALGLQNGAVTSAGSISIHATFLSGDLTTLVGDFSKSLLGNVGAPRNQHRSLGISKPTLLASVSLTFLVGASCAALLIGRFGTLALTFLLIPLCAAAALSSAPRLTTTQDENT